MEFRHPPIENNRNDSMPSSVRRARANGSNNSNWSTVSKKKMPTWRASKPPWPPSWKSPKPTNNPAAPWNSTANSAALSNLCRKQLPNGKPPLRNSRGWNQAKPEILFAVSSPWLGGSSHVPNLLLSNVNSGQALHIIVSWCDQKWTLCAIKTGQPCAIKTGIISQIQLSHCTDHLSPSKILSQIGRASC